MLVSNLGKNATINFGVQNNLHYLLNTVLRMIYVSRRFYHHAYTGFSGLQSSLFLKSMLVNVMNSKMNGSEIDQVKEYRMDIARRALRERPVGDD